ncbi:FAD dependent oxidoreductase-domain-containing protein [Lentinula detonsa]|uniref:FAD dependent oxidoreductase-domain-containing protein n=1 Tax=Lentinula detonsa TaxID=2804962 RepID=A0AA38Q272_9AGAR|nr:FAD dependent oxidoreductase-domain-containing protein [Lentinula detonsa]
MAFVQPTLSVPTSRLQESQDFLHSTRSAVDYLPVQKPTKSFWIDSPDANPLATEGSTGFLPAAADICIVGSGITGVSVAYHLATRFTREEPLKVIILEARDFCSGATGRNGGHLTPNSFIDFSALEAKYGQLEAKRALDLESHTAMGILEFISSQDIVDEVDLVAGGHVTMFVTDDEFCRAQEDYHAARVAGVDLSNVEWLSKEEMYSIYGVHYPGARYGGHNLWPLKLVTHLYNFAKFKMPLSLHTSTPVSTISPNKVGSPHRWKVHTPRGSVSCSYVVHATNAYASHLLPHLRGPSGIVPTRGQVMAVRASVPLDQFRGRSSWDANDGFEYWFPRPVTTISEHPLVILGGGREVESRFEYGEIDDSKCSEIVSKVLSDFLPGLFRGKFELGREPVMEWTGIMGFTSLRDPFVGPVGDLDASSHDSNYKGQFIAAGYSGHGMPRAYACGEVIATMIIAETRGESWNAPKWLPHHYLTSQIRRVNQTMPSK